MKKQKNKVEISKRFWLFILLLVLVFGFTLGFFVKSFAASIVEDIVLELTLYACHDGCSFATKNKTTNLLNNKTWVCWDECNDYFEEIKQEFKCEK